MMKKMGYKPEFAGAVETGDHDAAVLREPGKNRERGGAVETVVRIDVGHMGITVGIGRNLEIAVDAEDLTNRHFHVGKVRGFLG